MIQKIEIKNFQSHAKTELPLSSGLNVIIGETDSGKSAIIRALNWTLFNRISGDNFIRNGQKESVVRIKFDDENVIERRRTKSINEYKLNKEVLKSFRSGVPENIEKITRMNELNFQAQFDGLFMLSERDTEVTKRLNKLVDFETMEKVITGLNSDLRSETILRNKSEENVKEFEQELKNVNWIDAFEEKIEEAGELENALQKKEVEYNEFKEFIFNIRKLNEKRKKYDFIKELKNKLQKASELPFEITRLKRRINDFNACINKTIRVKSKMASMGFLDGLKTKLKEAKELYENYEEMKLKVEQLYRALDDFEIAKEKKEKAIDVYTKAVKERKEKFPDICPLCGNKINKERL